LERWLVRHDVLQAAPLHGTQKNEKARSEARGGPLNAAFRLRYGSPTGLQPAPRIPMRLAESSAARTHRVWIEGRRIWDLILITGAQKVKPRGGDASRSASATAPSDDFCPAGGLSSARGSRCALALGHPPSRMAR
jgi:hypothetical protein